MALGFLNAQFNASAPIVKMDHVHLVGIFAVLTFSVYQVSSQTRPPADFIKPCLSKASSPDMPDVNCFYECIAENMGIMDKVTGKIITIEQFKQLHPEAPANLTANFQICATTSQKETPCETGYALHTCLMPRKPKTK